MLGWRNIDLERPEHAATASLWLGGLSLFVCWIPLLGLGLPVAALLAGHRGWYTANQGRARLGVALGTIGMLIGIFLLFGLIWSLAYFPDVEMGA